MPPSPPPPLLLLPLLLLPLLLPPLLSCSPAPAPAPDAPPAFPSPAAAPTPFPGPAAPPPAALSQAAALLALKSEWTDPAGFLLDWTASNASNVCYWWGVTCSTDHLVTSLHLAGLFLSGSLSSAIANLSTLSTLDLSRNNLSGGIPHALGSLPSLTTLHLAYNSFIGSIPSAIFQSSSLQFLLLHNNNLSGQVPSSIAQLISLRYLSLQSNVLTGPFLSSITNLTNLEAIYVGFNEFDGLIPPEIGNLTRLVFLDLSNNIFYGEIPCTIASLSGLRRLLLSNNQLEGRLPADLGNLQRLFDMRLAHNALNGEIPAELGNMTSLQSLDLSYNNLGGPIPVSLGNLTMLRLLNLSYNMLSGEVPVNGVLARFNSSSYEGNGLLCGGPLQDSTCNAAGERVGPMNRRPYRSEPFGHAGKVTIIVIGAGFGLVVMLVIVVLSSCRSRRQESMERSFDRPRNSFAVDTADSMRKAKLEMFMEGFPHTYEEIVSHAGYFDTAHVLGKGRFASVYRSDLPGGRQLAVKVFNNAITQSIFEREMVNLSESTSNISNILPIKGYYSNPIEKAIFYDIMPKGTLYDVLRNSPTLLDWHKRINIALGVAQAVHHLHTCSPSNVLHKDLKSSNVLLDDDLCPHVADYGLISLVSKIVVETPGYTPPEFTTLSYSVRRYTEKTDVYSFGVIVLELLTGKGPVASQEEKRPSSEGRSSSHLMNETYDVDNQDMSHVLSQDEELDLKVHLVTWVLSLHKEGQGLQGIDPFVVQSCPSLDHQTQVYNLAILCIDDEASERPSMLEIATILENLLSDQASTTTTTHQS